VAARAVADYVVALTVAGSLWLAAPRVGGLVRAVILARARRAVDP
jgi:hypothetical protein